MAVNQTLFPEEELIPWLQHWVNMPEFECKDYSPQYQVLVNFTCAADLEAFAQLIGQNVNQNISPKQLKGIWFPEVPDADLKSLRYSQREEF